MSLFFHVTFVVDNVSFHFFDDGNISREFSVSRFHEKSERNNTYGELNVREKEIAMKKVSVIFQDLTIASSTFQFNMLSKRIYNFSPRLLLYHEQSEQSELFCGKVKQRICHYLNQHFSRFQKVHIAERQKVLKTLLKKNLFLLCHYFLLDCFAIKVVCI